MRFLWNDTKFESYKSNGISFSLKILFLWCHDVHAPRALILSINISRLSHFSKTITYSSIVIFNTNEKSWCNYFLHFVMQNVHFLHVLVKINFEDIFLPWHYFFLFSYQPSLPENQIVHWIKTYMDNPVLQESHFQRYVMLGLSR